MRFCLAVSICAVGLGLAGCNADHRNEPAARQAGRDAYKLKEEGKRAAKEVGRELKNAGREARQGWNEAKREQPAPKKK